MKRKTEKTLDELYDDYFKFDALLDKFFVFLMVILSGIAFFAITQIAINIFNNK